MFQLQSDFCVLLRQSALFERVRKLMSRRCSGSMTGFFPIPRLLPKPCAHDLPSVTRLSQTRQRIYSAGRGHPLTDL